MARRANSSLSNGAIAMADTDYEGLIKPVMYDDDLARLFDTSPRTIKRKRAAGVFPIPTLPSIDEKPRTSGHIVQKFLTTNKKLT